MVADDPDNKIDLDTFHCCIVNDHDALTREIYGYKRIIGASKTEQYDTTKLPAD
ncbi:hypothetical protein GCM10023313_05710 [Mucilaginibacter defluvii]|uniref:Uncharacterized protein n=1 Tax=Mucilaginibacter defluvii TaxID=1196019 RepID=A0ABP9FJW1_9SPHI